MNRELAHADVDRRGQTRHSRGDHPALFELGLNLGETSMLRLGGNFTIMMMVSGAVDEAVAD
jgi:hypothetical protein